MNLTFDAMIEQFNSIENGMKDYKTLTKSIIKSIAKSEKTNGANLTCSDLVTNNYNDVLFDDLVQEVALAFISNATPENVYPVEFNGRLICKFQNWNVNGKEVNGYLYLMSVVRKYIESNKNPRCELVSDFIGDGETEEIASNKAISDYVRIASENACITGTYDSDEMVNFFRFVKSHKKYGKIYDEMRTFSFYLVYGLKINQIAVRMDITESRAYYLRKTLAKAYSEFNPIERREICFAKVETIERRYMVICGNDVLMDVPTTTYKRVFPRDGKITIAGKDRKATIYTDVDGNIVIPKDGTRIKKYVINMSKNALSPRAYGTMSYIDKSRCQGGNIIGASHPFNMAQLHNNVVYTVDDYIVTGHYIDRPDKPIRRLKNEIVHLPLATTDTAKEWNRVYNQYFSKEYGYDSIFATNMAQKCVPIVR